MLISHQRKFIFLHLPKTAGTSITVLLEKTLTDRERAESESFNRHNLHIRPKDLRPLLPGSVWETYFKFGFVRNPWDWLVSIYFYFTYTCNLRGNEIDRDRARRILARFPRIEDFLKSDFVLGELIPTGSAFDYFFDPDERPILNFVGRFETIEQDFAVVARSIGMPGVKLPHVNISSYLHYSYYYDDASIEKVRQRFQKHIDYFGYRFQKQEAANQGPAGRDSLDLDGRAGTVSFVQKPSLLRRISQAWPSWRKVG